MKIRQINLYNFGSYEGLNTFSFRTDDPEKRVVVIGGKNGAGKTTLFTAIQTCLYGMYAFGYKTAGKHYQKEIYNLINNNARIEHESDAYLEVIFEQIDNTDLVQYSVRRSWKLSDHIVTERFEAQKNGIPLAEEDLLNFQNYLLHLIPPDMLKLYFFDGEKIADYFLDHKVINIRDTLMILSGNDTFDILHDNIRRILKQSENADNSAANAYMEAKQQAAEAASSLVELQKEYEACREDIERLTTEIEQQKKAYADRGGITLDEWKELNDQLKAEEEKRERINWQRREVATEILPFLMIPELMAKVPEQMNKEKDFQTYFTLKSNLQSQSFMSMLIDSMVEIGNDQPIDAAQTMYNHVCDYFLKEDWSTFKCLFGLSDDEIVQVQSVLGRVRNFDISSIKKYQKRINNSITRSKELREKLQNSNLDNFEDFLNEINEMETRKKIRSAEAEKLQQAIEEASSISQEQENSLKKAKKAFEEQLKQQSVGAVSGRVLLLLEDLQAEIYGKLIEKVERDLNEKFRELLRKKSFFSQIVIDHDFTVHILRNQNVAVDDLTAMLKSPNFQQMQMVIGRHAVEKLKKTYKSSTAAELRKAFEKENATEIMLPIEISQDRFSSGEKQIFVMSLYWAMMQQSKNELPFIIDTPFARIDAEHRANITEYFFKKLDGQLMVLSTDEEISGKHLETLQNQISQVYMLEYGEDKRTYIRSNQYFEV